MGYYQSPQIHNIHVYNSNKINISRYIALEYPFHNTTNLYTYPHILGVIQLWLCNSFY